MGTRGNDQGAPRQPLLSSLVVRPSGDSGAGVGSDGDGVGVNYESAELRQHQYLYSSPDRYDSRGHRQQTGSFSFMRHRGSPGLERTVSAPRNRWFDNGRDSGDHRFSHGRDSDRYRDFSPSYSRGRDFRFDGRPYDRSAHVPGPVRGEGPRNNPNVRPREGDWICIDPSCKNLNFARRERCNNCNMPRYAASTSLRRGGYPRNHSPLMGSSPRMLLNSGYRSPPRSWQRDIIPRHEGRVGDTPLWRDRLHFDSDPRRSYGGRLLSPSPGAVASHDWPYIRNRSRTPVRGGPPPKKYRHDVYMDQRQEDHRVFRRDVA